MNQEEKNVEIAYESSDSNESVKRVVEEDDFNFE